MSEVTEEGHCPPVLEEKPQDMTTTAVSTIRHNLKKVADKVYAEYINASSVTRASKPPRLVAVSKTKPKEMIFEAYDAGHRHFGENYVQELAEKSNDPELLRRCPDIQWHFIGNCQIKNVNKLAKCPKLTVIETITSEKLADKLQTQFAKKPKDQSIVNVMVQVNTSGEENKNGVEPGSDTLTIVQHIKQKCPNLKLIGLMTIGALGHSIASTIQQEEGANPDFLTLIECRQQVADLLQMQENSLELSMGMSNDFAEAIKMGSTNVRIGSSIFGSRNYPNKPAEDERPETKDSDKTVEKVGPGTLDLKSTTEGISEITIGT